MRARLQKPPAAPRRSSQAHLVAQDAADGSDVGLEALVLQLHQGGLADVHADGAAGAPHQSHQILGRVPQAPRVNQQPAVHVDLGGRGRRGAGKASQGGDGRRSAPAATRGVGGSRRLVPTTLLQSGPRGKAKVNTGQSAAGPRLRAQQEELKAIQPQQSRLVPRQQSPAARSPWRWRPPAPPPCSSSRPRRGRRSGAAG